MALERLAHSIRQGAERGASLRESILDGIEHANRVVQQAGAGATTLALVEVTPDGVRSYHVGDSVVLVSNPRGGIILRTIPHSPVGYLFEAGVLDEREALDHEALHLIDNVVGAAEMRIEIGPRCGLGEGDTVLLASDGLFDNLRLSEILQGLRSDGIRSAADVLLEGTRKRMFGVEASEPSKPDDLSYVVFRR